MIHKLDKETVKRIVDLHQTQGLSFPSWAKGLECLRNELLTLSDATEKSNKMLATRLSKSVQSIPHTN